MKRCVDWYAREVSWLRGGEEPSSVSKLHVQIGAPAPLEPKFTVPNIPLLGNMRMCRIVFLPFNQAIDDILVQPPVEHSPLVVGTRFDGHQHQIPNQT